MQNRNDLLHNERGLVSEQTLILDEGKASVVAVSGKMENCCSVTIRLHEVLESGCQNRGGKVKGTSVLADSDRILYGLKLLRNLDLVALTSSSITGNEQNRNRTTFIDFTLSLRYIAERLWKRPFLRS